MPFDLAVVLTLQRPWVQRTPRRAVVLLTRELCLGICGWCSAQRTWMRRSPL